jgi:hypothetical protein
MMQSNRKLPDEEGDKAVVRINPSEFIARENK